MTNDDSNTSGLTPLARSADLAGRPDGQNTPFRRILVDIDTTAKSQPALDLATLLARRAGAQLQTVDAARESRVLDQSRREVTPPHDILIQNVKHFGHDLVIRSQERDLVAHPDVPRYSVNTRLFRQCPCPVWAAGVRPNLNNPRVLVTVNPISRDPVTKALDAGAIRLALAIRSLLGGELTVLHAWLQPAERKLYFYLSTSKAEALIRATERRAADALDHLVDTFGRSLTTARIKLKRGAVEEIGPALAVAEGIDIVITGARSGMGIWRLLFGSTAEQLLKATPCSVIAFKLGQRFESA